MSALSETGRHTEDRPEYVLAQRGPRATSHPDTCILGMELAQISCN